MRDPLVETEMPMRLITPKEKGILEKRLGMEICPLGAVEIRIIGMFGREALYFGCDKNGPLELGLERYDRPCSIEYAKKCPVYLGASQTPVSCYFQGDNPNLINEDS